MSPELTAGADPTIELLRQQLGGAAAVQGGEDPQLSLLTRLLDQRQAQLEQELGRRRGEEEREQAEAAEAAEAARAELIELTRRRVEELAAELEPLRARLDLLAGALGACPGCWGDDGTCRWCRGRGRPGFAPPDPEAFADLVVPVVRAQARLHKLQPDGPGDSRAATLEQRESQERRPA